MATKQRCCRECGNPLAAPTSSKGRKPDFCSTECRKRFNNRRMTRGAILYDLFMGVRYERSRKAGDLSTMTTVARVWHDEDQILLDGRKTWTSDGIGDEARDIITDVISASVLAIKEHRAKSET